MRQAQPCGEAVPPSPLGAAAIGLRAAGESVPQIADTLGISLDTAYRYFRATLCTACSGPVVAGGDPCQRSSLLGRVQRAFTREQALDALRAWARETGDPRRRAAWQTQRFGGAAKWTAERPRFPSASMISRLFGSWEAAQRGAGFTPGRRRWTNDAIIDALRRDADRRGRPPFYAEWQHGASYEHPDTSTAVDRFGTWREALRAAGLPPRATDWDAGEARGPRMCEALGCYSRRLSGLACRG